jgi:hypothetical protein
MMIYVPLLIQVLSTWSTSSIAFSKLFLLNDPRLQNINVQGDIVVPAGGRKCQDLYGTTRKKEPKILNSKYRHRYTISIQAM